LLRNVLNIFAAVQNSRNYCEYTLLVTPNKLLERLNCSILGHSDQLAFVLRNTTWQGKGWNRLDRGSHIFWDVRHIG
jgi:hypothetical protein